MALFNPAARFRKQSPKADGNRSMARPQLVAQQASGEDSDDWVVLTSESEGARSEAGSCSPRSTRMHTISASRLRQAAALQLFDDTESDGELDSIDERSPASSPALSAPTRARLQLRSSCFGSPRETSALGNGSPRARGAHSPRRPRLQRSATWHIVTAQDARSPTSPMGASPRRARHVRRMSSHDIGASAPPANPVLPLDGSYVALPVTPRAGDGAALIRRSLAQGRPAASASAASHPLAIPTQCPSPQGQPARLRSSPPAGSSQSPRQQPKDARGARGASAGRELMSLLDAPLVAAPAAPEQAHGRASPATTSSSSGEAESRPLASWLRTVVELRTAMEKQSFGRTKTVVLGVDICFEPEHTSDAVIALARTASFTWMDRYKKFLWPHSVVTGATLSSVAAKHGLEALVRVGAVVASGVALMTEDALGLRRLGIDWRIPPPNVALSSAGASLEDEDDRHQFARAIYYLCWGMVNGNLRKSSSGNFWFLSAGMKNLELKSPESFSRGLATLGAAAEAEVDKYFPRSFYAALRSLREAPEFCRVTTFALDEMSALLSHPMAPDRISMLAKVLLGQFDT